MADPYQLHIHFGTDEVQAFKEAFNRFDKDGDGIISSRDLHSLMKSLGIQATDHEVETMISTLDDDGTQTMDFPEFLQLMNRRSFPMLDSEAEISKAFEMVDQGGKGELDRNSLALLMSHLGRFEVTDEEIDELLRDCDVDNDGVVSLSDFRSVLSRR